LPNRGTKVALINLLGWSRIGLAPTGAALRGYYEVRSTVDESVDAGSSSRI
jgi:hypothetical protein